MGVIEHLCPKLHTQTPFLINLQTPKDTKVNLCEGKGHVSMDVLQGGVMEHNLFMNVFTLENKCTCI